MVFALALSGEQTFAASGREDRAYAAAASAFQDGMWSRAEVEFAEFAEKYPKSGRVAEAVLMQGEADIKQGKFLPAMELLTAREAQADKLADQYVYWLGQAQFQNGDYTAAAATFSGLERDYSGSSRRLDAAVAEAAAHAKLGQWPQVSAGLQAPDGVFQTEAGRIPADDRVVRGQLLLAEALLRQNQLNAAAAVLNLLDAQKIAPELNWEQVRLRCRVQLAGGDTNAALASTTNLLRLADLTGQAGMRAESVMEQGGILAQMGRTDEALPVYQRNLSTNVPVAWQRQAVLKIAELAAAQRKFSDAAQSLEQFLAQFPDSPAADIAQLTLGEVYLREYLAQPAVATNGLSAAEAQFNRFLGTYTNSPFTGKAYLDQGWCFWVDDKIPESLVAFKTAAGLLLPSPDLAVARFKMGDALFAQKDYAGARDNYEAVVNDFTNLPDVENLVPQALYQTVRACMKLGDMTGTTNALARILTVYPTNKLADSSLLLAGEQLSDLQQPAKARALFEKVEQQYPNSPLRPEVELALARTYEQENNWPPAIGIYDRWVEQYTNEARLLPQVVYARAWANFQAGRETNALQMFTNFVAQFPTNPLAPVAQWWVGDFYSGTGTNYVDAERNYQLLFQRWPASSLAYPARMAAGRAAMGRLGYSDAIQYFMSLTSDTNCPPGLDAQALFAYGSALMLETSDRHQQPAGQFRAGHPGVQGHRPVVSAVRAGRAGVG